MELKNVFEPEIGMIKDGNVQKLVRDVLDHIYVANRYFYKAQASSSGKFHPHCCNVKGGLIRHVKRAVDLGLHICRAWALDHRQTDVVVAALILHDIWKNDFKSHAFRGGEQIREIISRDPSAYAEIGPGDLAKIIRCVRHHMGPWTEKSFAKPMAEYSLEELAVYTADYIASRRDVIMPETDGFPLEGYEELRKVV